MTLFLQRLSSKRFLGTAHGGDSFPATGVEVYWIIKKIILSMFTGGVSQGRGYKNTTTKTPTAKTPPQEHHHKNTTTKTSPQKHHHTTTKTPPQYYSSTTLYYKDYKVLQSTAPVVLKVLLCTTKYYSVLQSTIPVLLCTTLYYKVLLQYYPVLEVLLQYYSATTKCYSSTTPVQKKLPKWSFRARLLPNFTEKASKTSVSCEASDNFHRRRFQNDRFVRSFIEISQKKVPKRAFRAKLPTIFTEEGSKMIVSCEVSFKFHRKSFQNERCVSCEASDNFHRRRFQNDRFVRGFIEISQKKVPKRAFRARLLQNFTAKASKTSVSCEASNNFHRRRFQNDRFVRGFIEISQKKVPKRGIRARLLQNFTKEASKMIVSCEASLSFQNERFARCFWQFSQKKLPKGSFRAMLPTIFTEKTSKRTESLKWKKIPPKNGKNSPKSFGPFWKWTTSDKFKPPDKLVLLSH